MERGNEEVGRPALGAGLGYYRRGIITGTPMAAPDLPTTHLGYSVGMNSNRGKCVRRMNVFLHLDCLKGFVSKIRADGQGPNNLRTDGRCGMTP